MRNEMKILLIGYGNPGRRDDGLGPAFAQAVGRFCPDGLTIESDYQLVVEDAHTVAQHDIVVFVDADTAGAGPFQLGEIHAGQKLVSFSSHSLSPEGVLALARDLFQAIPKAYLLGIRGYEFNQFRMGLSQGAQRNLHEAVAFWRNACDNGLAETIREFRPDGAALQLR